MYNSNPMFVWLILKSMQEIKEQLVQVELIVSTKWLIPSSMSIFISWLYFYTKQNSIQLQNAKIN